MLDGDPVDVAGLRVWGVGDPRFTPDQRSEGDAKISRAQSDRVRAALRSDGAASVDLVAVHDPASARGIGDLVPLVLAGHRHEPAAHETEGGMLLVEGSTGGAGLRGLQGDESEPLTCTVLHFSRSGRLVAYDRVTVEAFGQAAARIERHIAEPEVAGGGSAPEPVGRRRPWS